MNWIPFQAAVLTAPCTLGAVTHLHNHLLLQLWICVEGISAVDTMSHKAQMALRLCLCRYWGPAVAELAVWDSGTMERVVLRFVWKDSGARPRKAPLVSLQLWLQNTQQKSEHLCLPIIILCMNQFNGQYDGAYRYTIINILKVSTRQHRNANKLMSSFFLWDNFHL